MTVRILTEAGGLTTDPRGTGKMLVKIIDAGVGTSAEYTTEALQQAATSRVFPAGTHMYLDHADGMRRTPSGGRSIRDLASVTTTDAWYDETERALVAEAQAVSGYADTLESIADHVGLSISATAEVDPPTRTGGKPVVRQFLAVESIDWVVKAGRGGKVLAILESATTEAAASDRREQLDLAIRDMYADRARDIWAGVRDFDDAARIAWFYAADGTYQQSYTVADDDLSVTLTGDRTEVRAVTTYVPVSSVGVTATQEEKHMPEISQAELDRLTALDTQLAEATQRAETAEAKLAEAEKASKVDANRKTAAEKVAEAAKDLPASMVQRITATIEAAVTDELPADLDAQISRAVEAEKSYAATLSESAKLVGFGQTVESAATPKTTRTTNAFGRKIQED